MKLSTAIRRGTLAHMYHAHVSSAPQHSLNFTSCVLGTAWLGLGRSPSRLKDGSFVLAELSRETQTDLLATIVTHPFTGLPMSLSGAVVDLDLTYDWTAEKITGWLADLGY